jgi:hypothetical protein
MGQAVHSFEAYGVLYPGYTLAAALVNLLGGAQALLPTIAILHAALAGFFVYALARELGARPSFAIVASISLVMSGHVPPTGDRG